MYITSLCVQPGLLVRLLAMVKHPRKGTHKTQIVWYKNLPCGRRVDGESNPEPMTDRTEF